MERMVAPVIELIWRKVVDSFSSRMADQMADNALNSMKNIADFQPIFEKLQKNLKSLDAKAADVEEETTNRESSGRKKRKREVKEWLEEVESIKQVVVELGSQIESEGFITRLTDGGKAAQLNERVEKLVDQSRTFGELVLDVCGTSGEIFLTNGLVGQAFSENLKTILRLLESREVSSIGVYGMGGVGKTTLVKHINNHLLQRFEGRVFWVTVSQEFTITSLQDKIARCVGVDLSNEDNEDKRASRLHTALSATKNSVLILDDVWDYIDVLKVGCSVSAEWCRLIITTRSFGVCGRIGCQWKIPIEKLNEGEAWKLFNERLGNEKELDREVEGIAKSMVKLCGGLPLGIITVAGSMRGKRGTHRWRNAFLELQERVKGHDGMGEDEVFEVLKFSFDRLKKRNDKSSEFDMKQLCFLYCSLYPEDYKIGKEGLVRNFISEGLVSERKSRRARVDQGHSIIDELVDVCLLESCVNYNNLECVKMHDLVRSMALKICNGKYMAGAGDHFLKGTPNEVEWTKDLEKVFLANSGIYRIEEGISPDCPKLSTLLLWGNPELMVIPESFFSKMQGLCTLDLCNTQIKLLPDSISDMTRLKVVLLEDCFKLEKVPHLGNLKALRELNLSHTAIKEVPQGLEKLLKLEFLSLIGARRLTKFPSGLLQQLIFLQQVSIPSHIKVPIADIRNLKLLEEFYGRVERVEDFNSFMRSVESCQERDTWYTIIVGKYPLEEVLRSIESSCFKKKLGLFECNLEDERVLGQDTEYIMISECEGLSISFLDDFLGLKKLEIESCGGIEWLLRSDGQFSNTLQEIKLWELDDLKGVMVMERGEIGPSSAAPMQPAVFSSLKRLEIFECNNLRKVGLPVSKVPNLEVIEVKSCREIEEIFEEDEGRTASVVTTTTLPKLKELTLSKLPRLRTVGLPVSGVPNLERIHIWECGEIEEIFEEDEGRFGSIVTTLPKLTLLHLNWLPRLKSISKGTIICNSVRTIDITSCPRLMNKLPLHFDDPAVERKWRESLERNTVFLDS